MKKQIFILISGLLILYSCSSNLKYDITKKTKTVINNDNCLIKFNYPKVNSSKYKFEKLNDVLEKIPDYKDHSHECHDSSYTYKKIKGDYQILLNSENMLSIEFIKQFYSSSEVDTMISGIVINPIDFELNKNDRGEVSLNSIIPNFDRGTLYKYVEQYNANKSANVNLKAYESNSNYHINWAITENQLILYLGGEGEIFGYDKIRIPLIELRKENKLK